VMFRIGHQPVYLLNHPDLVEAILVTNSRLASKRLGNRLLRRLLGGGLITSQDEEHLQQRRMLQPLFHRRYLAGFADLMVDCVRQTSEHWQSGETLDIFEEMTNLTLRVVGRTLFSAEFEPEAEDIRKALAVILGRVHIVSLIFGELADRLPLPMTGRTHRAVERLNASIYRVIDERRIQGNERRDLLSLLLEAEDESGKLSDMKVRDQAMSIFLAGFETMAVALAWTWFLLAQHPDIEARFLEEIDRVLAGRLPIADDLPNLKYTRQVLTEVLRLYPPVWAHGRRLAAACKVGAWELPAGSFVIINHWLMHHDPRFYSDPEKFDPDRWAGNSVASRPRLAYAPFSAGPRQCIGEGYAWMEGVLVMATLAQQWQLSLVPGQRVEMQPLLTLRPRYGLLMTLNQRTGQAA
jgi:cytochrome P450